MWANGRLIADSSRNAWILSYSRTAFVFVLWVGCVALSRAVRTQEGKESGGKGNGRERVGVKITHSLLTQNALVLHRDLTIKQNTGNDQ